MKIEVWAGAGTTRLSWYWHVVARNGRIVSDSEGYTTLKDAVRAATSFIRSVCKRVDPEGHFKPIFKVSKPDKQGYVTIRWS